ncbi:serine/threonine protein kinase [Rubrivivax albus]|uniref:serine/threonine protein kinase n=1 Tax=Rubrivivax albus TaxID=2499835 RepID=UPI0018EE59A8|nr:serine/threonine-protein kinase [Rubrivivax albus]
MTPPVASPDHPANALPRGARLGEFEILAVLGVGGFGIVYRALDHALEREVAIKEYMPAALAGRTATLHVSLRSQSDAETFALGLRSFVNEAKLLARFDHPSLLKVYRFWEQNDTAYMAMPIYHGQTLKAVRQAMQGPPDEAWLRAVLGPLLGAIETLHAAGVYHRDIAPDNILIEPDGRPVLLDFGAARRVIGDRSQTLTAILKPAYAPIEQYAEVSASRQGPWTDLYALGATLHYVLTGEAPAPATARTLHDDQLPLVTRTLPGCSPRLLAAVDWMLATRPADRPQSVAVLRAVLEGTAEPPAPGGVATGAPATGQALPTTVVDVSAPWPPAPAMPAGADAPTLIDLSQRGAASAAAAPAASVAATAPAGWQGDKSARRVLPVLLGLLGVAAVAVWWWSRTGAMTDDGAAAVVQPLALVASAPASGAEMSPPASARGRHADPVEPSTPAQAAAEARATAPDAGGLPARSAQARGSDPTVRKPPPRSEPEPPPVVQAAPPTAVPTSAPATAAALAGTPAPASAPAPIVNRTPVASPAALSDDPSAVCGKRVLLALFWCMERECASDEFKGHPACRKWFATNRQRQAP